MVSLQSVFLQKKEREALLMRETRTVYLTDIQYDGQTKILSVIGPTALKAFRNYGTINAYDADSAPKE